MIQHQEITYNFLLNASSKLLVERVLKFAHTYKLVDLRNDRAVFYQDDLYRFNEFMVIDSEGNISKVPCSSIPEVVRPTPKIAKIVEEMDAIYEKAARTLSEGSRGRSTLANLYSHGWHILKIDDGVYVGSPYSTDVQKITNDKSASVSVDCILDLVPLMLFRDSFLKDCVRNYFLTKGQS